MVGQLATKGAVSVIYLEAVWKWSWCGSSRSLTNCTWLWKLDNIAYFGRQTRFSSSLRASGLYQIKHLPPLLTADEYETSMAAPAAECGTACFKVMSRRGQREEARGGVRGLWQLCVILIAPYLRLLALEHKTQMVKRFTQTSDNSAHGNVQKNVNNRQIQILKVMFVWTPKCALRINVIMRKMRNVTNVFQLSRY